MGEQPARWVHLAQFMDISGFRGVFGGEIGSVTSKHFRLDDNGISVYIPYPCSHRIDQSLTRHSIVFHCFAQGALAYYDSTGVIGYTFRPDKHHR